MSLLLIVQDFICLTNALELDICFFSSLLGDLVGVVL
jgi:hypothetical protein